MRPTPVTVGEMTFDVRFAGPEDGTPVDAAAWLPRDVAVVVGVAPLLVDAGLRVIAPDQRGYSPGARPPASPTTPPTCSPTTSSRIADALGLGSFHLVGHDWGAAVAWVAAANHADRLRTPDGGVGAAPGAYGAAAARRSGPAAARVVHRCASARRARPRTSCSSDGARGCSRCTATPCRPIKPPATSPISPSRAR